MNTHMYTRTLTNTHTHTLAYALTRLTHTHRDLEAHRVQLLHHRARVGELLGVKLEVPVFRLPAVVDLHHGALRACVRACVRVRVRVCIECVCMCVRVLRLPTSISS